MSRAPEYHLAPATTASGMCVWCDEHADKLWDVRGGHYLSGYSLQDCVCESCAELIVEKQCEQDARDERTSRAAGLDLRERLERDRQLMERGR
ncbi:MAG: hypothetical protein RLZZ217_1922 [Planctomycetota bacterium]|jgi:hypothetical protein